MPTKSATPTTRRRARRNVRVGTPAPLPASAQPMLCTLIAEPFDHPDWIVEPKYDGLRVLARFDGSRLSIRSRNDEEQSLQFPDIAQGLRESLRRPALVDGEVVCLDEQGESSFRLLQQRFHIQDPIKVQARMRLFPACIYLFDILYAGGYDVRNEALEVRKSVLRDAVRWSDRVRWTPFEREHGTRLWRDTCAHGREGIIGKQLHSRYIGGRSSAWVKIKCLGRQEFVIGGFTEPQRSRVGLGALLVGYYSDDGKRLIYAGKVGTSYTRAALLELRQRLGPLEQAETPFDEGSPRDLRGVHWVRPRLVAEVAFGEWAQ